MYDTFEGECPSCKEVFQIQTKRDYRSNRTIRVGDDTIITGKMELKDTCPHCGIPIVVECRDGRVQCFSTSQPDSREGLFGCVLLEGETRKEHQDRIMAEMRRENYCA